MMEQPDIRRVLPHRYPFLLIDRITEFVPERRISGLKTFTADECYASGHFPGAPLVPCGILLEMTTQLGAVLVMERAGMEGRIPLILHIPLAEMRVPAYAGDVLRAEAEVLKLRGNLGELQGTVFRGREIIANGHMRFAIAPAGDVWARPAS